MRAVPVMTLPQRFGNFFARRESWENQGEAMARIYIRWVVENYSPKSFHCELHSTHLAYKTSELLPKDLKAMEKERIQFLSEALGGVEVKDEKHVLLEILQGHYTQDVAAFVHSLSNTLIPKKNDHNIHEETRLRGIEFIHCVRRMNEIFAAVDWTEWGSLTTTFESRKKLRNLLKMMIR